MNIDKDKVLKFLQVSNYLSGHWRSIGSYDNGDCYVISATGRNIRINQKDLKVLAFDWLDKNREASMMTEDGDTSIIQIVCNQSDYKVSLLELIIDLAIEMEAESTCS